MPKHVLNYRYEESAKKYAKTDVPFEKIALKFALLDNKEPLKVFLKEKLTDYTEFNKVSYIIRK